MLADCYRCYSQGGHVTVGHVPVWVDGWHVGHVWEGHGGYGGAHWAGGGWPRAWAGTVCPRSGVHLGVHLQRPPAQKRKEGDFCLKVIIRLVHLKKGPRFLKKGRKNQTALPRIVIHLVDLLSGVSIGETFNKAH